MQEVEFHTGVGDPVGFACRLLRKAYRQGARVQVTAPRERLAELDRALWVFEEREFVPHLRMPGGAAAMAERTPIWLSPHAGGEGAPRLVVNLGADAPDDLQAVDRLIEIVGTEPGDVDAGRARWRRYKAAGLEIKHHGGGSVRS